MLKSYSNPFMNSIVNIVKQKRVKSLKKLIIFIPLRIPAFFNSFVVSSLVYISALD